MTCHKKLIDITASLGRNGLSLTREKVCQKTDQVNKNAVTWLSTGIACSYSSAPAKIYSFFI